MGSHMGEVRTTIEIQGRDGERRTESLDVVVDTGATLPVFPKGLLDSLGIRPEGQVVLLLGDGRPVTREVADVRMRVEGSWVWSRAIIGESEDAAVLGLTVLEQLGLTVDPIKRRLVPTDFILF